LRLFSFGGYGLALAALALVVCCAYDSYPAFATFLVLRYGLALAALALVIIIYVVIGAYDCYPPVNNQRKCQSAFEESAGVNTTGCFKGTRPQGTSLVVAIVGVQRLSGSVRFCLPPNSE